MRLYEIKGELLDSVKTKSGNIPRCITVIRNGDLVYSDFRDRSINQVNNTLQIQTLVTLRGWRPLGVCCTSSADLLVTMISDDNNQSRVVRYNGSIEKQIIQWDNLGNPIFQSIGSLTENRNLDICVTDSVAGAVVVVRANGKLRFKYTASLSDNEEPFYPLGIAADSHEKILISDCYNKRIHIVDRDGNFLRYINCSLHYPWGLCVDFCDNLYVADWFTAKVKKIKYYF